MKTLLPILLCSVIACKKSDYKEVHEGTAFTFPVIVQEKTDSIEAWRTDGIQQVFPLFAGQYKIGDTIHILDSHHRTRERMEEEAKWEEQVYTFDTLSSDGLQLYPDYLKPIVTKLPGESAGHVYFPVYVVNQTTTAKSFLAKDNYVLAIQEARGFNDRSLYYAIEERGFDVCGNGYFRRKLLPNEFIVFLMPKYSGKDTTYLRIRLNIGDNLFVSKPYKASFNKSQFEVHNNNMWAKEIKEPGYKWMFYGGSAKTD